MLKVEEYRKEAANCRRMAAKEADPKAKASLLSLAKTYDTLAQQREHYLDIQEEIRTKKEARRS